MKKKGCFLCQIPKPLLVLVFLSIASAAIFLIMKTGNGKEDFIRSEPSPVSNTIEPADLPTDLSDPSQGYL